MSKWVLIILFTSLAIFAIQYSLDINGSSILDGIGIVAAILALIVGVPAFLNWRKEYQLRGTKISLVCMLFPIAGTIIYTLTSFSSYQKIHKPYHLFARLPNQHNYEFYFRNDSTLKIVGHYMLGDDQTFQPYHMQGDTVLLDTIIPCSGVVSKKYVIGTITDSRKDFYKVLVPINDKGYRIEHENLYIDDDGKN